VKDAGAIGAGELVHALHIDSSCLSVKHYVSIYFGFIESVSKRFYADLCRSFPFFDRIK
jgi:hypothetical protein